MGSMKAKVLKEAIVHDVDPYQLKKPVVGSSREGVSTLDLFRRKNIRHRTIIFACSW